LAVCLFFPAEDGIRDRNVTGVQTCALPISRAALSSNPAPATTSLGTAPLAVASAAPSGPVAGFEDNAARAVYWLAEKVESDGWRSEERRVGKEWRGVDTANAE